MDYAKHSQVGRKGEAIAEKYLRKKGYTIIDTNYRQKYCEIDIVAWHKNTLVIVEVRTKTNENRGRPEDTINYQKLKKLNRNAQAYMAINKFDCLARIDAICIILDPMCYDRVLRLDHYESITY